MEKKPTPILDDQVPAEKLPQPGQIEAGLLEERADLILKQYGSDRSSDINGELYEAEWEDDQYNNYHLIKQRQSTGSMAYILTVRHFNSEQPTTCYGCVRSSPKAFLMDENRSVNRDQSRGIEEQLKVEMTNLLETAPLEPIKKASNDLVDAIFWDTACRLIAQNPNVQKAVKKDLSERDKAPYYPSARKVIEDPRKPRLPGRLVARVINYAVEEIELNQIDI